MLKFPSVMPRYPRVAGHSGLFLSLMLTVVACNGVTFPRVDERNPTAYTWTVDTLDYRQGFQTIMTSVWGSSASNVYVVGHNGSFSRGEMWHYDGGGWTAVPLATADGGKISPPFDLQSIDGFDSTSVYAVGMRLCQITGLPQLRDSSLIIKFDGQSWQEIDQPHAEGLASVLVDRPDNVWCGGDRLYHFDGSRWLSWVTPQGHGSTRVYVGSMVARGSGVLASLSGFDRSASSDDSSCYQYAEISDEGIFAIRDSFTVHDSPKWGSKQFWKSPSGRIYSCGYGGVFAFTENGWLNLFRASCTGISGSADDHIFATVGAEISSSGIPVAGVYFYNGSSWERLKLPELEYSSAASVWSTDGEVFIIAHDGMRSYVIHGK